MVEKLPEVLPCPVCRKKKTLRVGDLGMLAAGVECNQCGLSVKKCIPGKFPAELPADKRGRDAIIWLARWILLDAIKVWNSIPRKPSGER